MAGEIFPRSSAYVFGDASQLEKVLDKSVPPVNVGISSDDDEQSFVPSCTTLPRPISQPIPASTLKQPFTPTTRTPSDPDCGLLGLGNLPSLSPSTKKLPGSFFATNTGSDTRAAETGLVAQGHGNDAWSSFPTGGSHCSRLLFHRKRQDETAHQHCGLALTGVTPYDVLCGKGRAMQRHPGSIRFRNIIHKAIPYYEAATTRSLRTIVIDIILDQVFDLNDGTGEGTHGTFREDQGARHPRAARQQPDQVVRFIKYDSRSSSWMVMSRQQVRDKIGHALRGSITGTRK